MPVRHYWGVFFCVCFRSVFAQLLYQLQHYFGRVHLKKTLLIAAFVMVFYEAASSRAKAINAPVVGTDDRDRWHCSVQVGTMRASTNHIFVRVASTNEKRAEGLENIYGGPTSIVPESRRERGRKALSGAKNRAVGGPQASLRGKVQLYVVFPRSFPDTVHRCAETEHVLGN